MKSVILSLAFLITLLNSLISQAPDYYNHVDHLVWVVSDIKAVKKNWQALGFTQISDLGEASVTSNFEGKSETFGAKLAIAWLGGIKVLWVQPKGRTNIFGEFLRLHQDGVFSIVHTVDDKKTLKYEAARLKKDDVMILDFIEMKTKNGRISYFFFNTEQQGKYVLGFTYTEDADHLFKDDNDGENLYGFTLKQFAFTVKQEQPVSDFWVKLGLPPFKSIAVPVTNRTYYSDSSNYEINLSWQRHGDIDYEWYTPVTGSSIYDDHISIHGEGLDHLNFAVSNPENVVKELVSKGFVIAQSGRYDEHVKTNSGNFYDIESKILGGVGIEITGH